MPTITTTGSGNWSSTTPNAPWPGGVLPLSTDDVVIANTHTVTFDSTAHVATSLLINNGGTATASTAASSRITLQNGITNNGSFNVDLSAFPSITFEALFNAVNNTSSPIPSYFRTNAQGAYNILGAARTRKTTLVSGISAGATTATVASATGWRVGDRIIFATTSAFNATPATDEIIIVTVNTGTGVITWTGGTTNAHAASGYVGNFTSNVRFAPNTVGQVFGSFFLEMSYGSTFFTKTIDNVAIESARADGYFDGWSAFNYKFQGSTWASNPTLITVSNCCFYDFRGSGVSASEANKPITLTNTVFYSANVTTGSNGRLAAIGSFASGNSLAVSGCGVFRVTGAAADGKNGIDIRDSAGVSISDTFMSGCGNAGIALGGTSSSITDVDSYSNNVGVSLLSGSSSITRLRNGVHNAGVATNATNVNHSVVFNAVANSSYEQTAGIINSGLSNCVPAHVFQYVDKNNDVTQQEIYRPFMSIKRDNVNRFRSTSSVAIQPTAVSTNSQRTLSIPCANGSSIRVVGYVKKSHASNIAASVALSGLGSAWGGFTAAANTNFQIYDTGTVTNSSGVDGNFTLTYTANSSSGTTNTVYFDGVPDSPFVTKARHYGFVFDEANPSRVVNPTISASEATAWAYTGITIVSGTSLTIGASKTFQNIYDYSQAWGVNNLAGVLPIIATGSAGNPSIQALANITTTGFTLNGGGSLDMVGNTLTANQPWPYTYTGGVFSQAATVPSFSGGTLTISTTGTRTITATNTAIVFTAAGTYPMDLGTLTGVTFSSAVAGVTVNVSAGATYTNLTPANVTVSAPITYQQVTINGLVVGSQVQIFDTTNGAQIDLGVAASSAYTWTDTVSALTRGARAVRLRIAHQSGTTAKNFIEANIGTMANSGAGAALSYLASQTDDTVYIANAINGSAVTGITINDGIDRMVINIAGGSVSWPQIYAYNVYWLSTAAGIVDDGSIIIAKDTANYSVSMFKIRNSSTTPLSITGGYGVDATTGTVAPIIDVAGSTGNIYQTPEHVVPYQTTGAYAITGDISTVLAAIPSASTNASAVLSAATSAPIAANVKQVNSVTIQGAGNTLDPMRPV